MNDVDAAEVLGMSEYERMLKQAEDYKKLHSELVYAEATAELIPTMENALHAECARMALEMHK